MTKKHSSEAFYALDDPLETAVFSVLVDMTKKRSEKEDAIKETELSYARMLHVAIYTIISKALRLCQIAFG
jgi:hypothetical protein